MTDDLKAPERLCYVNCGLPDDQCVCYQYVMSSDPADRIATLDAALADMTRQRDEAREHWAANEDQAYRNLKLAIKAERERDAAMVGAVRWQWRSRIKGGLWDSWENGRYGQDKPPFMDIEERILPDPDRMLALTAAAYEDAAVWVESVPEELDQRHVIARHIRARAHADALAALSRIEAQAKARGMRKAAEEWVNVRVEGGHSAAVLMAYSDRILALADATEAAASGAERANSPALPASQPGEASASSAPATHEAAAKGGV